MSLLIWTLRQAKRLIVTALDIGVDMIVLPGPAIVVISIGLGILATEFVWGRSLLLKIKQRLPKCASKVQPTELGGNL